ncbi:MAG: NUDIX domain-containing protein [Candidatus Aenigmatarchaeota archaeon]
MAEEFLDVLDEKGNVTGKAKRSEVHGKGLIHRTVMFFIFDAKGRIFVNQRTQDKEFYGGCWSLVLGGHVSSGQTHDKAVLREAEEEAGIRGVRPESVGSFRKRDGRDQEHVHVYAFTISGKPRLDPSEIRRGTFMTIGQAGEKMKRENFLPETARLYAMLTERMANFQKGKIEKPFFIISS